MEAKNLHTKWQKFKDGPGADMIKVASLKFNSGLGPSLDTLDAKWGTSDGQKAADKLKGIVKDYKKVLDGAKIKPGPMEAGSSVPKDQHYALQKKLANEILDDIKKLVDTHKLQPAVKKAGK